MEGLNHKTAPLEVRERFAISEQGVPEALRRLRHEPEVKEALILI